VRAIHREDWERPRGWIKIEAIREVLEDDFDFVFWIDADAIAWRRDVDVRTAAVDSASLQMAWHGPDTSRIEARNFVPHFNSGIMLIRVNDWSHNFFRQVWEVGQLPHHWSDQATILHLLGYDDCLGLGPNRPDEPNRSRLARLDTVWNSTPGLAVTPDPIIHHYAGISNPLTRLRMIEVDARTVHLREGAGPQLRQAFADQLSLWREDATMRIGSRRSEIPPWPSYRRWWPSVTQFYLKEMRQRQKQNPLREKSNFACRFNVIWVVQIARQK
jgi:hypothetical protein